MWRPCTTFRFEQCPFIYAITSSGRFKYEGLPVPPFLAAKGYALPMLMDALMSRCQCFLGKVPSDALELLQWGHFSTPYMGGFLFCILHIVAVLFCSSMERMPTKKSFSSQMEHIWLVRYSSTGHTKHPCTCASLCFKRPWEVELYPKPPEAVFASPKATSTS